MENVLHLLYMKNVSFGFDHPFFNNRVEVDPLRPGL